MFNFHRAFGVCVAIGMLAGCGRSQLSVGAPGAVDQPSKNQSQTFNYTGGAQDFTVPAGVTKITVAAIGAQGAGSPAAYGGRVHATVPVKPGEQLVLYVGGNGSGTTGGFNGGGTGGSGPYGGGYGGGGASDIREGGSSLQDRIIVSGGGGGVGQVSDYFHGGRGGMGGGKIGGSGKDGQGGMSGGYGGGGGTGGTQNAGGRGGRGGYGSGGYGSAGESGSLGTGGAGGSTGSNTSGYPTLGGGAGGGGGYYGGGGGGSGGGTQLSTSRNGASGGGGGGSSFAERSASGVKFWQGWKKSAHNGLVVLTWQ